MSCDFPSLAHFGRSESYFWRRSNFDGGCATAAAHGSTAATESEHNQPIFPLDIHIVPMYRIPMIRKELVAASAEPLVLSLLAKGESYGYAIIQEVKARSEGKLQWTDGML